MWLSMSQVKVVRESSSLITLVFPLASRSLCLLLSGRHPYPGAPRAVQKLGGMVLTGRHALSGTLVAVSQAYRGSGIKLPDELLAEQRLRQANGYHPRRPRPLGSPVSA